VLFAGQRPSAEMADPTAFRIEVLEELHAVEKPSAEMEEGQEVTLEAASGMA